MTVTPRTDEVTGAAGEPLLSIRDLVVEFATDNGTLRAVDGVGYDVMPGEIVGVVGESGSGKSVTALAALGLIRPPGKVVSGEVLFRNRNILSMTKNEIRHLRGAELCMIFQDPMTALNPVMTVGRQLEEAIKIHDSKVGHTERKARIVKLLELVGIPNPSNRYDQYPHEYSGGMRQRAMIAMAIANEPALLLADEPTTALDVTIQAQVLDVLRDVIERTSCALIFITHDLGVVAEIAHRVVVMYAGRVVETGTVENVFSSPRHPYTVGLMASLPRLSAEVDELVSIPGQPPDPVNRPVGCDFEPRCSLGNGRTRCQEEKPLLEATAPSHLSACHYWSELTVTSPPGTSATGTSPPGTPPAGGDA